MNPFDAAALELIMHAPVAEHVERIAGLIVDSGLRVHKALGPGLLESVYERCLIHELAKRGCQVERQVIQPIVYDGLEIEAALRLDLLVGEAIVVEVKSVESILPIHRSQLLTYLKLSGHRLGFLMNFNVALFKNGIQRLIV
jgi:GxxExxY protein